MKRYLFALSVLSMLMVAGCGQERVVGLDDSVDQKINALIEEYKSALVYEDVPGENYGWMASINTKEGYYRFWIRFHENGAVDMCTDNTYYPNYKGETDSSSTWVFNAYQRPTLVFDTYNYLSILNDPDNAISHGADNQGLVTDFEFEVRRYDRVNRVFQFQGRFNKVNAIFRMATEKEMKNAQSGMMMDVVSNTYKDPRWQTKYIHGVTPDGTSVAVKLYDQRKMFLFAYNSGHLQIDTMSCYNVEVDDSGDLFFPESIDLGSTVITGTVYENDNFTEFSTEHGANIPLEVTSTPPDIPIGELLGMLEEKGRMYNALKTTGSIVSALGIKGGVTYNALNLMDDFFIYQGLNFIASYDQVYYFTLEETDFGPQYYLWMTMTPMGQGFGFGGGTVTVVTSFPTATYRFLLSNVDLDAMTFNTGIPNLRDAGARQYYNDGITRPIIDGLTNKKLKIQWSELGVETGMVVEFMPQPTPSNPTIDPDNSNTFIPAAILTNR